MKNFSLKKILLAVSVISLCSIQAQTIREQLLSQPTRSERNEFFHNLSSSDKMSVWQEKVTQASSIGLSPNIVAEINNIWNSVSTSLWDYSPGTDREYFNTTTLPNWWSSASQTMTLETMKAIFCEYEDVELDENGGARVSVGYGGIGAGTGGGSGGSGMLPDCNCNQGAFFGNCQFFGDDCLKKEKFNGCHTILSDCGFLSLWKCDGGCSRDIRNGQLR